jgi:hypothetical protein
MEDHIDQICKEKEKTKRKCMRSGQNLIMHTALCASHTPTLNSRCEIPGQRDRPGRWMRTFEGWLAEHTHGEDARQWCLPERSAPTGDRCRLTDWVGPKKIHRGRGLEVSRGWERRSYRVGAGVPGVLRTGTQKQRHINRTETLPTVPQRGRWGIQILQLHWEINSGRKMNKMCWCRTTEGEDEGANPLTGD